MGLISILVAVAEVKVDEVDDDISSSEVAISADTDVMPMPLVTLEEPETFYDGPLLRVA